MAAGMNRQILLSCSVPFTRRPSQPLDQFIRWKGGISACAARFSRWVGRGRATRLQASRPRTA
jgi:hypothetical protein